MRAIFYRNKGAYIVARVHTGDDATPILPLVMPLLHGERGIEVDKEAVVAYGNAINELAAANIFAGDMLLKNFGVSRHRRVLFYDYDELSLLIECRFRDPGLASR